MHFNNTNPHGLRRSPAAGSGCGDQATSRVEISQCNGSAYAHSIGLFENRRGAAPLVRFG
jgi:hypothetical protein